MPRFLLVTCERGTLVPNPHINQRRYCGKPKPGPVWADGEQPVVEVVQDDPALRKAHRNPADKFSILAEGVFQGIAEARASLMSQATPAGRERVSEGPSRAKKAGDS